MNNISITIAILCLFIILFIIYSFFFFTNDENESRSNLSLNYNQTIAENYNKWYRVPLIRDIKIRITSFIFFLIHESEYGSFLGSYKTRARAIKTRYVNIGKNLKTNPEDIINNTSNIIDRFDYDDTKRAYEDSLDMIKNSYSVYELKDLLTYNLFLDEYIYNIKIDQTRLNISFIDRCIYCVKNSNFSLVVKYYLINFLEGWLFFIEELVIQFAISFRDTELKGGIHKNRKGKMIEYEIYRYNSEIKNKKDEIEKKNKEKAEIGLDAFLNSPIYIIKPYGFDNAIAQTKRLNKEIANLESEIANLETKIENRKIELRKQIKIYKLIQKTIIKKLNNNRDRYFNAFKKNGNVNVNKDYKLDFAIDSTFDGIDYFFTPLNVWEIVHYTKELNFERIPIVDFSVILLPEYHIDFIKKNRIKSDLDCRS